METNTYDHLTLDLNYNLISLKNIEIGSGMATNSDYPELALIYSFERYVGTAIYHSWCPKEEAPMAQLLAYASAIRWDAEVSTDHLID